MYRPSLKNVLGLKAHNLSTSSQLDVVEWLFWLRKILLSNSINSLDNIILISLDHETYKRVGKTLFVDSTTTKKFKFILRIPEFSLAKFIR